MGEVRFHLDENMHHAVAIQLRRFGIDVSSSTDVGLLGATDHEQLQFALQAGRVIVTYDDDLLILGSRSEHAGIVYCNQRSTSIGRIVDYLRIVHGASSADEMHGRIEFAP